MATGSAVVAARAANPYGSVLVGNGQLEAAVDVATLDADALDAVAAEVGDPNGAACATGSAACIGADALPATVYSPSPAQGGEVADDGKCGK